MDFVLALLPWPIVWGLTMRRTEKIGVAVAMSMGVLSVPRPFPSRLLPSANEDSCHSAGITGIIKTAMFWKMLAPDFCKPPVPMS